MVAVVPPESVSRVAAKGWPKNPHSKVSPLFFFLRFSSSPKTPSCYAFRASSDLYWIDPREHLFPEMAPGARRTQPFRRGQPITIKSAFRRQGTSLVFFQLGEPTTRQLRGKKEERKEQLRQQHPKTRTLHNLRVQCRNLCSVPNYYN